MSQSEHEQDLSEMQDEIRDEWQALTDEDVAGVVGSHERLIDIISARYGVERDEAERQVKEWMARVNRA